MIKGERPGLLTQALIFGTLPYRACFRYAYFNQTRASCRTFSPAYKVGGVRERGKNEVILDGLPKEGGLSNTHKRIPRRKAYKTQTCVSARFKYEDYTLYLLVFSVFGLPRFKNEEYTYCLYLALLGSHALCSLHMAYRSAVYFSMGTNGTNRQVVYARPSVVNICSLQMVY